MTYFTKILHVNIYVQVSQQGSLFTHNFKIVVKMKAKINGKFNDMLPSAWLI